MQQQLKRAYHRSICFPLWKFHLNLQVHSSHYYIYRYAAIILIAYFIVYWISIHEIILFKVIQAYPNQIPGHKKIVVDSKWAYKYIANPMLISTTCCKNWIKTNKTLVELLKTFQHQFTRLPLGTIWITILTSTNQSNVIYCLLLKFQCFSLGFSVFTQLIKNDFFAANQYVLSMIC